MLRKKIVYCDYEFTIRETYLKRDERKLAFDEFGWLPVTLKYKAKPNNDEVCISDVAEFPIEIVARFHSELNN